MTDLDAPFTDPFDEPVDHPLMGKRVEVIMNDEDPPDYLTGVLTALDAGGGITVRQDDGKAIHGWPALAIVEVPNRLPRHCPRCGEPDPVLVSGEAHCRRCTWTAAIKPEEKP